MNLKLIVSSLIILLFLSGVFGATTIQIRRDNAANWTSANPILAQGEMGYELDTSNLKFGDGTTTWNSLDFFEIGNFTGDTNFANIGFSGLIFGDGSKLTGVVADSGWPEDSTLDTNQAAFDSIQVDLNLMYCQMPDSNNVSRLHYSVLADLNNEFVTYISATNDLNLNTHGINAFGDSNFNNVYANFYFGNGSGLTGIILDINGTNVSPANVQIDNNLNVTGDSNFSNIQADAYYGIDLNQIGFFTVDGNNLEDWFDTTQAASIMSGGGFTCNGDGSLTVEAGYGLFKTTDNDRGITALAYWAKNTNVSLTDNSMNYLYISYNGGTPVISATVTKTDIDHTTELSIGIAYRDGNDVHFLDGGVQGHNFAKRVQARFGSVEGTVRASGMVTTETGTLNLDITQGKFFNALNEYSTSAFDSSGADTFSYWFYDGAAWVEGDSNSTIDNARYNDIATGLENLTVNKYGVHWVYMHQDDDVHVIYGQENETLAGAQAAILPASLPSKVVDIGIFIAKIIIQNGETTTFTDVDTPWETTIASNAVTDHGALGGLSDDDHTIYVLADGTRNISGDFNINADFNVLDNVIIFGDLNVATGDSNFTNIQATSFFGGIFFGTLFGLLPDSTLDLNTAANTSWLGKAHTFTANQTIQADLNITESGTDNGISLEPDFNRMWLGEMYIDYNGTGITIGG